jgi:hypothetical protein
MCEHAVPPLHTVDESQNRVVLARIPEDDHSPQRSTPRSSPLAPPSRMGPEHNVCALGGEVPDSQELIRAVGGQNGKWPPICLSPQSRTPGRPRQRMKRRRCTQARHIPPPDWCVGSELPSSRSAPALTCVHDAFLEVAGFGRALPPGQPPRERPLWGHPHTWDPAWGTPCTCALHHACAPLLTATRVPTACSKKRPRKIHARTAPDAPLPEGAPRHTRTQSSSPAHGARLQLFRPRVRREPPKWRALERRSQKWRTSWEGPWDHHQPPEENYRRRLGSLRLRVIDTY